MHKNARLTPKGRALMLGRLEAGQHQLDVAQAMGVSLTTLKKWARRYRAEGAVGLLDRSCRPRHSPRQLSATLAAHVIQQRLQRRTGRFICCRLGVSTCSSKHRFLAALAHECGQGCVASSSAIMSISTQAPNGSCATLTALREWMPRSPNT